MDVQARSPIEINELFRKALDLLENTSRSVFITGRAGTGKSTFLDHFRWKTNKELAVLAPTGVAAVNISGETIHSFFGFGPGVTPRDAEKAAKLSKDVLLFTKLKMIIIDEVSMVRADLLDCVDVFLRTIRRSQEPFGGIQMVFIGDLYQLPPVVSSKEREVFTTHYSSPYFFDSTVMRRMLSAENTELQFEFIELEKIYRQHDPHFIALLNAVRNRTVNDSQIAKINERLQPDDESLIERITLTARNQQADDINRVNLDRIPGKSRRYTGTIEGEFEMKDLPTDLELYLKRDARVMLLNNDSEDRWINGTLGTIVRLAEKEVWVKLDGGEKVAVEPFTWKMIHSRYNKTKKEIESEEVGSFRQFPLRLAWAITIHKSQGKTFDNVVIDIGAGTFAHGQTYVALSRCRTYEGIVLKTPIKKGHILMDYRVVRFLTQVQYRLSHLANPMEEKIKQIEQAIANKQKLRITYLKSWDEKSKRVILPQRLGEMEFEGRRFMGLQAYCYTRQDDRVFNAERILEISEA